MTTRFMASSLVVAVLVAATGRSGIADFAPLPAYTVVDLGALNGVDPAEEFALNDDGIVVWQANVEVVTENGPITVGHAFRFTGGVSEDIGDGAVSSSARDVNSAGVIVGVSGGKLAVWENGIPSTPLTPSSAAHAINDMNVVAGVSASSAITYRIVDSNNGVLTNIGALLPIGTLGSVATDVNEAGEAVGWRFLSGFVRGAFRFTPANGAQVLDTLGEGHHAANAINDAGDTVGHCGVRACLWSAQTTVPTSLTPEGSTGNARGINNKGEIVGVANGRAFIRTGGQLLDLNSLIDTGSSLVLTVANDVNEHSQIVGRGIANDGSEHAFLLTPTAMPGETNVVATPVDSTTRNIPVKVTFAAITRGGVTTLTTSDSGPALPPGFIAGTGGVYYRVSTTAAFTTAEVRIDLEAVDLGPTPSLHQYESGTWVTVPSTFDSLTNEIRGQVTSLSTFVVLRTVSKSAPVVGAITLDPEPVIIGATVTAAASFTDANAGDTHSGTWTWGDGATTVATLSAGAAAGSHPYAAADVYTVRLTVTDGQGGAGESSATATVIYGICSLYDPNRAARRGSTFPIKLQICDASGANLSSPSIGLVSKRVEQISTTATGLLEDSGSSNPDENFRYESGLGGGGYIFNLSTVGLSTGTYVLKFVIGTGLYEYSVPFQVK